MFQQNWKNIIASCWKRMRNYKKVIEERYDRQKYDGRGIKKNMYAPVNPVGLISHTLPTRPIPFHD